MKQDLACESKRGCGEAGKEQAVVRLLRLGKWGSADTLILRAL